GVMGVRPPSNHYSPAAVASWIGKVPVYDEDGDVSTIGTGLLGNKFMAGKSTYRSGAAYGGFVLTADEYPTQSGSIEQIDGNGHLIDIGKYLSIVAGWGVLNTPWDTTGNGYITNMSAAYAGFVSSLGTGSAPTNKLVRKARLPYRVNLTKLDALSRFRYVMIGKRTKGVVWVDAPTAARPDSDYQRQSTVQTVKRVLNDIRIVCDPFIGEANSALQRAALKTQIDSVVGRYVGHGLKGGYCDVSATTNQEISGEATIELVLVPEFELRRITITMSLAATL
ncbi:MAG: hypothetical protein KJ569_08180, partial [Candidatus Omnitrophica bacterium]|nr:hypothetical protein [Candidatus Omnitrophota bacterium]